MPLNERQSKHLRRLGHALTPVVMIGSGGISDAVLKEVDGALNHHELIKVRIRSADRAQRAAMLETLLAGSGAELVQRIGHVALIFRRAADPVIALP